MRRIQTPETQALFFWVDVGFSDRNIKALRFLQDWKQ